MDGAKLQWDHFDAIEMAAFLGMRVDEVKRLSPKELLAATMRQIGFNARRARELPAIEPARERRSN